MGPKGEKVSGNQDGCGGGRELFSTLILCGAMHSGITGSSVHRGILESDRGDPQDPRGPRGPQGPPSNPTGW